MAIEIVVENRHTSTVKEALSGLAEHPPIHVKKATDQTELLVYSSVFGQQQSFLSTARRLDGVRKAAIL